MRTIRIGNYFEIPKIDHEQPAMVTRQEFYNFRNHVLRVLRVFGTAGPMGEVDLSVAEEDQPSFSSEIIDNPAFFVVDDMYNEQDRISIGECAPTNIDAVVIESLCAMMLMFPGWQFSFGLGDSGFLCFSMPFWLEADDFGTALPYWKSLNGVKSQLTSVLQSRYPIR